MTEAEYHAKMHALYRAVVRTVATGRNFPSRVEFGRAVDAEFAKQVLRFKLIQPPPA